MVIAGGFIGSEVIVRRSACFNGAGDGDRRRAAPAARSPGLSHRASTEPAMVIAGGANKAGDIRGTSALLQRSRRW